MDKFKIGGLSVKIEYVEDDFMIMETNHEYQKDIIEVLPMWKPVGSPTVDLDKLDFENWEKGLCTRHGLYVRNTYINRWWVWQGSMKGWATKEDKGSYTSTIMIRSMEFSWPELSSLQEAAIMACFPFPLNTAT